MTAHAMALDDLKTVLGWVVIQTAADSQPCMKAAFSTVFGSCHREMQ